MNTPFYKYSDWINKIFQLAVLEKFLRYEIFPHNGQRVVTIGDKLENMHLSPVSWRVPFW